MLYERPPTFRWNKRCGFSASLDCRPESASKFIIACIFACHLQSTGCRFTERKNCRKRSGQSGWTAGVTGNLIRAYNDPNGSDPLAESIRRIVSASGPGSILLADSILRRENDPSSVQVFRLEKSLAVRMIYDFSTFLEHFTLFRTLATYGNRLPDDLRLPPLREVSSKPWAVSRSQSGYARLH